MTKPKNPEPSDVDIHLRCDCGASYIGRMPRYRLPGIVRAFGLAAHHAPQCRKVKS